MRLSDLHFRGIFPEETIISGQKRGRYLVAGAIIILGRFIGDFALALFIEDHNSTPVIVWKTVSYALIAAVLTFYFFSEKKKTINGAYQSSADDHFAELNRLLLIFLGLTVIHFFLSNKILKGGDAGSVIIIATSDIVSFYSLILIILTAQFLFRTLTARMQKNTRALLKTLLHGLIYFSIFNYIFIIINLQYNFFVQLLLALSYLVLITIVFILSKRTLWISALSREQKIKLLRLSFFGAVLSLTVTILTFGRFDLGRVLESFMPGNAYLSGMICLFAFVYLLRTFFACIAALPTSAIVERRDAEINSLTYLNKLVSRTIDLNALLNAVVQLALQASKGAAAWIELYEDRSTVEIGARQNILPEQILTLHKKEILKEKFLSLKIPLLIESLSKDPALNYIPRELPGAGALIAAPLFAAEKRIGSLIVLHPDEYGFEHGDVKVLASFGDNISVALENARLVRDSIEKERYRKELLLAKEMQRKLLPQSLPKTKNYSIAAFSIPAEEVGGDFYDVGKLNDGRSCVLIGDVSGKGMNSAFYMAQLKGVALSALKESTGARDLLSKINATLYGQMEKQMFITMTALIIENDKGKVSIARAGHAPALIKNRDGATIVAPAGMGIGLAKNCSFDKALEEREFILDRNGVCLLFTDGVNELRNKDMTEYEIEPLKEILTNNELTDAEELKLFILKQLKAFSGKAPQHDDITVVSLIYKGNDDII